MRKTDVLLALGIAVVLFPFFLLASVITIIDTGFPLVFTQERVGTLGARFTIHKLRTFDNGVTTKVSDVIRRLGVDEYPQLWNVIKGDMSMVGPRPEVPERMDTILNPLYRQSVKPGMTGVWQVVSGHSEVPVVEQFDNLWIRHRSHRNYWYLIFLTPYVLMGGRVNELIFLRNIKKWG